MATPTQIETQKKVNYAVKNWCDSGLAEHSSVAGFSRVLVGLLNVDAPTIIINASQNAALDEIKHAKLCFGLANAIRVLCGEKNGDNRVLAPGALPVKSTLKVHTSLAEVAAASAIEGCVEETLSAFLAAVALDVLPTPNSPRYIPSVGDKISFVLKHITNDESRHASLAWYVMFESSKRENIHPPSFLSLLPCSYFHNSDSYHLHNSQHSIISLAHNRSTTIRILNALEYRYTVRWCLEEERKRLKGEKGDVHRSVYESFQKAFHNVDKDSEVDEDFSHDDSMWPYGILSSRTERFVGKRILRDVLKPWANALLNFRALPKVKTSLAIDSQSSCVHTNRVLDSIRAMETNVDLLNLDAEFSDEI